MIEANYWPVRHAAVVGGRSGSVGILCPIGRPNIIEVEIPGQVGRICSVMICRVRIGCVGVTITTIFIWESIGVSKP